MKFVKDPQLCLEIGFSFFSGLSVIAQLENASCLIQLTNVLASFLLFLCLDVKYPVHYLRTKSKSCHLKCGLLSKHEINEEKPLQLHKSKKPMP